MAIDFANSAIEISSPSEDLHNLTALTFATWVRLDSVNATGGILSINWSTVSYRKVLTVHSAGGFPYLAMLVDHEASAGYALVPPPSLDEWHYVCGRWQVSEDQGGPAGSDGVPQIFVDGIKMTGYQGIPAGAPLTDGGSLTVGLAASVPVPCMDGKLADAAVFDRYLSESEISRVAKGNLRATSLDPVWHVSLEGSAGAPAVGDVGLRDTTGRGNHINSIQGTPSYWRDPPLHWPTEPELIPLTGRLTRNSRPTMNVEPGSRLARLRRAL